MKWEFTREEQFIGATTRHPMTTHVKLGAKRDGTLTAIEVARRVQYRRLWRHGGETLAASLGGPIAAYRCPNKKADGYAVYTNMVPAGGFRGYGSSQTTFAIECAIDDLAELLGMDPFRSGARTRCAQTDWIELVWKDPTDVEFGSYGIEQCLDLVEQGAGERQGRPSRTVASGGGHRHRNRDAGMRAADRTSLWRGDEALPDGRYHLAVGSTEMGNGAVTSHRQIAAYGARHPRRSDRHHQCRHRSDALRYRHLRQHRNGGRGPGGGEDGCWRCAANILDFAAVMTADQPGRLATCRTTASSTATSRFRSLIFMRQAPKPATTSRSTQGLSVAALGRLQRSGRPARGAPHDR